MTTATTEANHALDNAAAWNGTISAAYEAFMFCQEQTDGRDLTREAKALLHEHSFDGTNHDDVVGLDHACKGRPSGAMFHVEHRKGLVFGLAHGLGVLG